MAHAYDDLRAAFSAGDPKAIEGAMEKVAAARVASAWVRSPKDPIAYLAKKHPKSAMAVLGILLKDFAESDLRRRRP